MIYGTHGTTDGEKCRAQMLLTVVSEERVNPIENIREKVQARKRFPRCKVALFQVAMPPR